MNNQFNNGQQFQGQPFNGGPQFPGQPFPGQMFQPQPIPGMYAPSPWNQNPDTSAFNNLISTICTKHPAVMGFMHSKGHLESKKNTLEMLKARLEQIEKEVEFNQEHLEAEKANLPNKEVILADLQSLSQLSFISAGVKTMIEDFIASMAPAAEEDNQNEQPGEAPAHHPA